MVMFGGQFVLFLGLAGIWAKPKDRVDPPGQESADCATVPYQQSPGARELIAALSVFCRIDRSLSQQIAIRIKVNNPANGFWRKCHIRKKVS
jgi:hypothetical protein